MSRARLLAAGALILVALNLRMPIAAVSPVLGQIERGTGLGSAGAGLLTAVPLFCFGAVASAAPAVLRRVPMGRLLGLTLVVIVVGCAVRLAPSTAALFAGTAVIGSGIAIGNVLLPGLIKRDFGEQAALMIGLYSVSLFVAAAIPAGLTVPIEHLTGIGWRPAIALWGGLALVALALWLPHSRRSDRAAAAPAAEDPDPSPVGALFHDRLAWAVTLFMGLQSLGYYATLSWLPTILEDHGLSDAHAGWMLSFSMFPGMAAALVTPSLVRRLGRAAPLVAVAVGLSAIAYLGLLLAPASATYLWVTALGLGQGIEISLALGFIVARARDGHHVAHLSTMAQSVGYLLASTGPFLLGALHGLTGNWTVPLFLLVATLVPLLAAGLLAARGGHVLAGPEADRPGGDVETAPVAPIPS